MIFNVTVVDANTITLAIWDFASQSYDAVNFTSAATYIGGGIVTLFPKMNIQGKDFNPFQEAGKQFKLSFIDFQMDANLLSPAIAATTIQFFVNSYLGEQANLHWDKSRADQLLSSLWIYHECNSSKSMPNYKS